MKRELLIAEFVTMPWAMMPDRISAAARMLGKWNAGADAAAPQAYRKDDAASGGERISAFEARRRDAQGRVGAGAIAVIPIYGAIVQRAGMMTEWCGGCSTDQVASALRDAMADDTIGQILLDVDSPGGSVYGVSELFDQIVEAKASKPVVAVANSLAASAAYWLACAATEVYVTPGGEVGSIGVWQAHEDWSKAYAEAGVDVTLIAAGKFKVEGNPYEPLDPDAKDFMQSRVNDYYGAFTKAVAKGRGVPIDTVRNGMGQGRVLGADQALAEKMVDGIATFGDVVKKMRRDAKTSGARPAGASRLAAMQRDIDILGC